MTDVWMQIWPPTQHLENPEYTPSAILCATHQVQAPQIVISKGTLMTTSQSLKIGLVKSQKGSVVMVPSVADPKSSVNAEGNVRYNHSRKTVTTITSNI